MISAAYRNWMYKECYDSFVLNSQVPIEFIFVGPNPPTEKMPDNFKYIETNVKPAQCLEIAARHAKGEYLIAGSDDERFNPNFLNRLYNYIQTMDMDKVFITFRYSVFSQPRDGQLAIHLDIPTSSFLGVSGCYRRDLWYKLGGIDRRWVGSYGDIDMQMRFYEYGFRPFLTPDCIMNEVVTTSDIKQGTLYRKSGVSDGQFLASLWTDEKNRTSAVARFDDKSIKLHSQGSVASSGKQGKFKWN